MRTLVRFLNGNRGAALLLGGIYCLARGVAYLPIGGPPDELPIGLQLISANFPIAVWGGVWLTVAAGCIYRAFTRDDALAWGFLIGLMFGWGVAYLLGYTVSAVEHRPSRDWFSATAYILPALIFLTLLRTSRGRSNAPNRDA
ncbi:hypothetical protein [Rathayibacter sp. AY2B5]|uniref:hypothetical protein n=1 Tax=Rathayibacter sp. AY2B5 TaxID=2080570 RepID=UPI000CE7E504|nr:hypothetical protein [Rathayibacter sp. AY2B5]PPG36341.1 hypothetical protein C5C30_16260 [Rathayibacter sp. AY2B5]